MGEVNLVQKIAIIIMFILAMLPVVGLPVSGLTVFLGIIFYIVVNMKDKKDGFRDFDPRAGYGHLTNKAIRGWIFLPATINILVFLLVSTFVPDFLAHVADRTFSAVSGGVFLAIIQLPIAALGEELAWRGFFQQKTTKLLDAPWGIIITSLAFALAHFTPSANLGLVSLDLLLVFINSVIYGVVYYKTKNAVLSSLSHLSANFVAIVLLVFF